MAIISRRGRQRVQPQPNGDIQIHTTEVEVYIYSGTGGQQPLTPEEQEHIKRVFDNIRKQLDAIGSKP